MFTKSVLSSIKDPELRSSLHLDKTDTEQESPVVWISNSFAHISEAPDDNYGPKPNNRSLQQSDLLRKFYLTIAEKGLQCAYQTSQFKPEDLPHCKFCVYILVINPDGMHFELHTVIDQRTDIVPALIVPSEDVIVVGAGMSGLVAAYELKKAGYNVKILEMSQRYGGRVKTLNEKDGFDKGLHTDGKIHHAIYSHEYIGCMH